MDIAACGAGGVSLWWLDAAPYLFAGMFALLGQVSLHERWNSPSRVLFQLEMYVCEYVCAGMYVCRRVHSVIYIDVSAHTIA